MNYQYIFDCLEANNQVFKSLLTSKSKETYLWRPNPQHWCLLEIICHLYDEEQEDFRIRLDSILNTPDKPLPPIHPKNWVKDRNYIDRNYDIMVHKFTEERTKSIAWLRALTSPNWDNYYQHPSLGNLTAHHFISNWLAHDYLHIRQITRLNYQYLQFLSKENLNYAGKW